MSAQTSLKRGVEQDSKHGRPLKGRRIAERKESVGEAIVQLLRGSCTNSTCVVRELLSSATAPALWRQLFHRRSTALQAFAAWEGSFSTAPPEALTASHAAFQLDVAGIATSLSISIEQLWRVYLPIASWAIAVGSRRSKVAAPLLLGITGSGGAGKSTMAQLLRALLVRRLSRSISAAGAADAEPVVAVLGMDAYHHTNQRLAEENQSNMKGRPVSFAIDTFVRDLQRVRALGTDGGGAGRGMLSLPAYDRKVHDPVPDRVRVRAGVTQLVLVEGLFLTYSPEVRQEIDLVVHLDAQWGVCKQRLVTRKVKGGKTLEQARAHVERVDQPNYEVIHQSASYAHLVLSVTPAGQVLEEPVHVQRTQRDVEELFDSTVKTQQGIVFAQSVYVGRNTYCGRDILGKNSNLQAADADARGYVPVEWWIVSRTPAENPIPLNSMARREGVSNLILAPADAKFQADGWDGETGEAEAEAKPVLVPFDLLAARALGPWLQDWPLVKLLDIGGSPVQPDFGAREAEAKNNSVQASDREVPPIPAHVHNGYIRDGRAVGKGKFEAYYFPPVDVPPWNKDLSQETIVSRLGIKPDTTKAQFLEALEHFALDDSMYALMNVYRIESNQGWTILPGVVHAPGPWLTVEMQRAQDDFNLLSWQLGSKLQGQERETQRCACMLRGLKDSADCMAQLVKWNLTTCADFEHRFKRLPKPIDSGDWGQRARIFFDLFYAESVTVMPGHSYTRPRDQEQQPFACVVWSGKGFVQDQHPISASSLSQREFLAITDTLKISNPATSTPLVLYAFFPLREKEWATVAYKHQLDAPVAVQHGSPSVLGIGNVCLDIVNTVPRYPPEDEESRISQQYSVRGGNTSNSMVVLNELAGAGTCAFLGTLGSAHSSSVCVQDLSRHGVDIGACRYHEDCTIPTSFIFLSEETGSRTITHFRDLPELSEADCAPLFDPASPYHWQRFRVIHVEGRNMNTVIPLVRRLRAALNQKGLGGSGGAPLLSLEIEKSVDGVEDVTELFDVVFVAREYILRRSGSGASDLEMKDPSTQATVVDSAALVDSQYVDQLNQLKRRAGAVVVLPWGDKGAMAIKGKQTFTSRSFPPARVVDTIGAGDTFNAAFLYAYGLKGADPGGALAAACRVAGQKVGQVGFDGLRCDF